MQTLIDPFELASRKLPESVAPQSGTRLRDSDDSDEFAGEIVRFPTELREQPAARLRCWCSED
jgi:hypothetical protein